MPANSKNTAVGSDLRVRLNKIAKRKKRRGSTSAPLFKIILNCGPKTLSGRPESYNYFSIFLWVKVSSDSSTSYSILSSVNRVDDEFLRSFISTS